MRVVLTGASGQLGAFLIDVLREAGHELLAWSGSDAGERAGVPLHPVDLTDPGMVRNALDRANPDAVLHAAAMSSAESVRRDPVLGNAVNVQATATLATWCGERGRRLLFTSTDLVFDGRKAWNREDDNAAPVLAYGKTKRAAEPLVTTLPFGLVARVSLLYGPSRCGRPSFFSKALAGLKNGEVQTFFEDEFRTPLDLASAARVLTGLLASGATGVVHVAGKERVSRFELMKRVASTLGLNPELIQANRQTDVTMPEPRPADVSLDTSRLQSLLPDVPLSSIEDAVRSFTELS